MRLVTDSKGETRVGCQLFLSDQLNPLLFVWPLHLKKSRITEENSWLATRYRSVIQNYCIVGWSHQKDFFFAKTSDIHRYFIYRRLLDQVSDGGGCILILAFVGLVDLIDSRVGAFALHSTLLFP